MIGSEWRIGDHVQVRGRPWMIAAATAWSDCSLLRLSSAAGRQLTKALLVPFDRPARLQRWAGTRVVRRRRWLHEVQRHGAALVPYGGAAAAARSSIRLLPYQVEPMLAVLRHGACRLLIADAVGLGKTIQAGLILLELAARIEDFRAVVLVPAGLRDQWREELRDRFDLDVLDADAAWLRASGSMPVDVNPWSLPGIYLTSIDFAKRPEVLRALEDATWDLMVLDEAHQASAASDRRAAAHAIGSRARRVLLLTATPGTGDPAAFAALRGIGAIEQDEPPLLVFRRSRADVGDGPPRRSALIRVEPTAAEHRMHQLLERYSRQVWKEAGLRGDTQARLATIVLRKRALSSAASLAVSARRRLDLLAGTPDADATQLLLPLPLLADEDPLPDAVRDGDLSAPGLADVARERRWLTSIADAARHASVRESKSVRLLRWLARVREPILVFTEYRDTLHRLERLIRATGRPLTTLHGGLDRLERSRVQAAFNRGGLSLLATDAAAEGLNLHHHCRIVIHYELPWRLARIEQRAGRVDRLGQARRVHEVALVAAGTAERLVLAPLARRAARARAAGDAVAGLLESISEAVVSEIVMGSGAQPALTSDASARGPADLRPEAAAEVARLEEARRWLARSPAVRPDRGGSAAVAATMVTGRRARLDAGLVLVFQRILTEIDGRRVHAEALVLHVRVRRGWPADRSRRGLRQAIDEIVSLGRQPGAPLHEHLTRSLAEMSTRIGSVRAAARRQEMYREERLRHPPSSAARQMVQAGLFDRRALLNMERRQAAHDAWSEVADARIQSLDRGAPLIDRVDLAAVLLVRSR